MQLSYLAIFVALTSSMNCHASENKSTAFKSFVVGDSGSSVQRQRGVDCAHPLVQPPIGDVSGKQRLLTKKMAFFEAAKDGDLVCTVRSQTIGGQPVAKTVLRLYSDRLLKIELSLKFKPLRRDLRNHYYPSSPEIQHVFDALQAKYGVPDERKLRHADCSCFVVYSDWKRPDGTKIVMERREESASEAKVEFTAPQYEQVFQERSVASLKATHEYIEANRRKAEEARLKNLHDL